MLQAPTNTVPYFHFVCPCGKPVKQEFAWYQDDKQYHKDCLPPAGDVSEEYQKDDDWGPENTDDLGFDSPTNSDEYEMNPEDCFEDPFDPYDIEYDR